MRRSFQPAASRTANKVAATAHELWPAWKLVRRRGVFDQAGSGAGRAGGGPAIH